MFPACIVCDTSSYAYTFRKWERRSKDSSLEFRSNVFSDNAITGVQSSSKNYFSAEFIINVISKQTLISV